MPACKLSYFNLTGLGESIRFLLSYAEIDFIDERIDREDWPKLKPSFQFGSLPVLEIEGKKINQSSAICRYIAKRCDLAGRDDLEALEIDAAADTAKDLLIKVANYFYESNEAAKAEKHELAKQTLPGFVRALDDQVGRNGGHFVGGRLSWADVFFASFVDYASHLWGADVIEGAGHLKALKEKVFGEPKIKAWIAKRPDAP